MFSNHTLGNDLTIQIQPEKYSVDSLTCGSIWEESQECIKIECNINNFSNKSSFVLKSVMSFNCYSNVYLTSYCLSVTIYYIKI